MKIEKKIVIVFIITVLVAIAGYSFIHERNINANAVANSDNTENSGNQDVPDEDWLNENCECLERNRFACGFEGFEYADGVCKKDELFTNPLRKCSKYDCSGEIYSLG